MDALRLRGFGFAYPGGKPVLEGVDWAVEEGAFVLLTGPTGCGKTTLLRCCTPQLAPHGVRAGSIELFGKKLAGGGGSGGDAANALGGSPFQGEPCKSTPPVGYVFQNPDNQMVCDSVWHELAFSLENAGMPQNEMRVRVAEVAQFFGMEPWFRERVENLSGGQKQALALASVLALRPRLLLLDEPTAMLDPVAERNFAHLLFRVNRELGITVVVATHSPEALRAYATSEWQMGEDAVGGGTCVRCVQDDEKEAHAHPLVILSERSESKNLTAGRERDPSTPLTDVCSAQDDARGGACARSVQDDKERGGTDARPASPPLAITIRDAYVRYTRDGAFVLRGLRLDVARGSIHALLGGNGCGKTTLLHAIAGTLKCERGKITNALKSRQALLPQNPKTLFVCDSVAEELAEWQKNCAYSDAQIADAAQRYGLSALMTQHPYDLSGGQQQLLALAKLELTDPDLLLADEPTKGLDAQAKLAVARALRGMQERGVTVVLATHDLSFAAALADYVTLLFDGQDACTRLAGEFFADNLFYRPPNDEFAQLARGLQ